MRGNSKPAAFPKISVRNIQRAITVNTVDLKKFAGMAVRCCLALHQRKGTDLTRLREIFIWIISDRRMTCLHRQFLNKAGSTDVLTFATVPIILIVTALLATYIPALRATRVDPTVALREE